MLAQTVERFVRVRLPLLAHMKSLLSLHFGRRESSAVLLLHGHWLPILIEEAERARRQVNFDFEFRGCKNSFAGTAGERPLRCFALLWRGGQSLAREEGAVLRKGDVNHTIRADLDIQE